MLATRSLILKTSHLSLVERLVRRSFLFRPLVRRFIAGDTLEEAMKSVEALCGQGLSVTLDYLGENRKTAAEAQAAADTFSQMLERIDQSPHKSLINISIKLTQCGLDLGTEVAEANLRRVLESARQRGNFVRVDMESSDYTERTIAMIERMFPEFGNTGTVLQSYLRRTPADLERLISLGSRIRLVKGAYLEPDDVAFPDKADVDRAYWEGAQTLLTRGNYPAIATHDEKIIRAVKDFVREKGIAQDSFEFQMLYGIRRDLQNALVQEGYRVRVYVPFGDQWYPYFVRRLAERPANAFFIFKSLFRG